MIKAEKILGLLFGIILFFVWLYILNSLQYFFFSEKEIIQGNEVVGVRISQQYLQVIAWLAIGLLPFFLIAGHYLLYSNTIGGIEKTRDVIEIKSILIGFLVWLVVIAVASLFEINIHFWINVGGGYLSMLIVYLLMNRYKI